MWVIIQVNHFEISKKLHHTAINKHFTHLKCNIITDMKVLLMYYNELVPPVVRTIIRNIRLDDALSQYLVRFLYFLMI